MSDKRALRALFEEITKLLNEHEQEISRACSRGHVAVLVHELDAANVPALRSIGWDGISSVFRMSRAAAKRLAAGCSELGDKLTGRWLSRSTPRVFLAMHTGTLLLNLGRDEWSIEPGSTGRAAA